MIAALMSRLAVVKGRYINVCHGPGRRDGAGSIPAQMRSLPWWLLLQAVVQQRRVSTHRPWVPRQT